jgi:hypothetical protein
MRHESIEISKLAVRRDLGSATRAGRMTKQAHSTTAEEATAVIDEAFAGFQSPVTTPALVSNIASQLRALDRQREQLAHLLRSVEASSISG